MSLSSISKKLGISSKELEKRAIIALLREELRKVRAEKRAIIAKYNIYGIKSFSDLMKAIESDILSDVDVHDDIVKLDYLESREKDLERLMEEIE